MSKSPRGEWRAGWAMLLAAAMGVGLSSAPIYALGVFMAPLEHAFGWSRTMMSSTVSLTSLVVAFGSPGIGLLLDRWGARRLALTGTALVSLSVAAFAMMHGSATVLLLMWTMLGFAILPCSPLVWQMAVANRFVARRGLALSLALCGSNLLGAIAPLLCEQIVLYWGWRDAYLSLATFMFLSVFPLASCFFYDARDLSRKVGLLEAPTTAPLEEGVTLAEALRSRNFWLLTSGFLLAGSCITGMVLHLFPILTSIGITPLVAASATSSMSIAAICSRLVVGLLMDRFFAPWLSDQEQACSTAADRATRSPRPRPGGRPLRLDHLYHTA